GRERDGLDPRSDRCRARGGGWVPAFLPRELVPLARLRWRVLDPSADPERGDPWARRSRVDRLGSLPRDRGQGAPRGPDDAGHGRGVARGDASGVGGPREGPRGAEARGPAVTGEPR